MISRQPSLLLVASQSHSHPQKIGPWKLGKTLGRGASGRVLLGVHHTTGQKAAVKVVSKSELEEGHHATKSGGLTYGIEREIIIMKLLTHPNVLRLYDVWETSKALYLVLEYVEGGELFDLLIERGPLHEQEAVKYFRQIILGTAYCHALGICHRDLKPENLLLDASLNVKLADFGMAALESNGKLLETSCGLPHYAAPEIVSGLKYHGAASDLWSCGVILFALLTGRLPFDDENIRNLLLKVQAGNFEMPAELSPDAQDLIWRMLTVDPNERISTSQVLRHRLLSKYAVPNEDLISVKSLPHPDTARRSLGSRKNIDPQILENLSILWNQRLEEDIINCLLSDGSNPEKTFYALLLRYRHNQDETQGLGGAGVPSPRKKMTHLTSNLSNTPKKNRLSQINAANLRNRPVLFQHRYGVKNGDHGRDSAPSSVQNLPRKSPSRIKLPRKRQSYQMRDDPLTHNLYNDIVNASDAPDALMLSMPPTLPSKDLIYAAPEAPAKKGEQDGARLLEALKIVANAAKTKKRSLMIHSKAPPALDAKAAANAKISKSKSLRQSVTSGLKRNSITIKLLSTYAKLSSETDWEYMDKQTKRTSTTFATLCDKIFNHEEYNEEDEKLVDDEEKKAKEYEAFMEIERKKREAEFRARRELAKQKKRQSRRSLLSLKKLHITVTEDQATGEDALGAANDMTGALSQPKRGQKLALRSVSEKGNGDRDDLTAADLELIKRRLATQPVPYRRQTPVLTRRPVSRLDPLWIAYENKEITRAHQALEAEYADLDRERQQKLANRELMVSVLYPGDEDEWGMRYELPPHQADSVDLSQEYMTEIRKLRLLNSQYNLHGKLNVDRAERVSVAKDRRNNKKTLIGEVEIPKVTRKSRHMGRTSVSGNSKRLSLISFRSTKELYRDLNSFLDTHSEDIDNAELAEEEQLVGHKVPRLRTSFADRLDRADASDYEDRAEVSSVVDLDEHLAKRASYHAAEKSTARGKPSTMLLDDPETKTNRHESRYSQGGNRDANNNHSSNCDARGASAVAVGADYTFSEDQPRRPSAPGVFDKIKLPDANKPWYSVTHRVGANQPRAAAMLVPDINKLNQAYKDSAVKSNKYGELTTVQHAHNNMPDVSVVTSNSTLGVATVVGHPTARNSGNVPAVPEKPLKSAREKTPKAFEDVPRERKRSRSIFRKMSWGIKKSLDDNPQQLPSPAQSGLGSMEEKKVGFLSRIFSGGEKPEVQQYSTILPRRELMMALFALLSSWRNYGLRDLRNDTVGFNITGAVSGDNLFHMKGCKFRIKVESVDGDRKSKLICAHVRGSKTTSRTVFKEIRKVLDRENVMDI
ncbi:Pkinase-domain-containing protein [Metschnikowia bicuspidata]|uniref:non-specific serine/threonine protein kinase n=1 Tax=Metschnikowia bicuspidata TaxID=27322 RepID=A0A4P9Z9N3_9ASCO|nr:Pkinase-domain-containing protein [Metschnikowia bicuspidata]